MYFYRYALVEAKPNQSIGNRCQLIYGLINLGTEDNKTIVL